MASSDHLALSDFIKSVHEELRQDNKILGSEEAWRKHRNKTDVLEKYASAMQELATNHWENNLKRTKTMSRVDWIYNFSSNYFLEEECVRCRRKEVEIANKLNLDTSNLFRDNRNLPWKLLDVGSCYNPFKVFDCFDVTAIDIAPAGSEVFKGDFLALDLVPYPTSIFGNRQEITKLQKESFDVVVFSLFLEYLPSPSQRLLCCEKAYNLLKSEGILFIITPDSNHVGANAKIMKSWRFVLAKLGFARVKYEKWPHLHCMVFRKSLKREIAQRWALLQDETQFFSEIVIPQDFKKSESLQEVANVRSGCDKELFEELPQCTGIDYQ